jgi:hypothetical protein
MSSAERFRALFGQEVTSAGELDQPDVARPVLDQRLGRF